MSRRDRRPTSSPRDESDERLLSALKTALGNHRTHNLPPHLIQPVATGFLAWFREQSRHTSSSKKDITGRLTTRDGKAQLARLIYEAETQVSATPDVARPAPRVAPVPVVPPSVSVPAPVFAPQDRPTSVVSPYTPEQIDTARKVRELWRAYMRTSPHTRPNEGDPALLEPLLKEVKDALCAGLVVVIPFAWKSPPGHFLPPTFQQNGILLDRLVWDNTVLSEPLSQAAPKERPSPPSPTFRLRTAEEISHAIKRLIVVSTRYLQRWGEPPPRFREAVVKLMARGKDALAIELPYAESSDIGKELLDCAKRAKRWVILFPI